MSCFEDVTISYGAQEYVVKSDRVMGLIETIESRITLDVLLNGDGIQRAKLAGALGAAIRYAGGEINDCDIYSNFFAKKDSVKTAQGAILSLLAMMIPPEHLRNRLGEDGDAKKNHAP